MTSSLCIKANHTTIFSFSDFSGIPETFIMNIVVFSTFLLIFCILRRRFWSYGHSSFENINAQRNKDRLWYGRVLRYKNLKKIQRNGHDNFTPDFKYDGFINWILAPFYLKEKHILAKSGPDAVCYLKFLENIVILSIIMTAISMFVVLPINTIGSQYYDNLFGRTTISNLDKSSNLLWVHCSIAIIYAPLILLLMRRSSTYVNLLPSKSAPTRIIMIRNIDEDDRNVTTIKTHIESMFESHNIRVFNVQLTYDVSKLTKKFNDLKCSKMAREYCEKMPESSNELTVRPNMFSSKRIPALEYYQKKEANLNIEVEKLRKISKQRPLGTAFVTLNSKQHAKIIIDKYKVADKRGWIYSYAPAPLDIRWENLSSDTDMWYLKWFTVNIILFIILFFLTTPAIITKQLNDLEFITITKEFLYEISPLLSEYLPVLTLVLITSLMPTIVSTSEVWLGHWSQGIENNLVLTKTFLYLLFMVLILPSLGLNSTQALLQWLSANYTSRWECIFLPDRSAFYVNYVITAAFTSNSLELLRLPQLLLYFWYRFRAKSIAEVGYIQQVLVYKFSFGTNYAWILLIYTISAVYSMPAPIITPFSMIYFVIKYYVDRYNLYYVYSSTYMISHTSGRIHETGIALMKLSIGLVSLVLYSFVVIRDTKFNLKDAILLTVFILVILYLLYLKLIDKFTRRLQLAYSRGKSLKKCKISLSDIPSSKYVPHVLIEDIYNDDDNDYNIASIYGINTNNYQNNATSIDDDYDDDDDDYDDDDDEIEENFYGSIETLESYILSKSNQISNHNQKNDENNESNVPISNKDSKMPNQKQNSKMQNQKQNSKMQNQKQNSKMSILYQNFKMPIQKRNSKINQNQNSKMSISTQNSKMSISIQNSKMPISKQNSKMPISKQKSELQEVKQNQKPEETTLEYVDEKKNKQEEKDHE